MESLRPPDSVREFQSQLAWREFYTQVLFAHPHVVSSNYKSYENAIEWENDEELLQAWKDANGLPNRRRWDATAP